MKINTEIIKALDPCDDRFNNYLQHYSDFNGDIKDFVMLENITYNDKIWVITKLFNKEQNVKFAIMCASSVLSIFESNYPGDNRPRKALEAAENWLLNPTEKNRIAAADADAAAYYAVYSAANAAYAAHTAAATAATADAAAYYATYTAAAAYFTNSSQEQKKANLLFAVEVAKEGM